MAELAKNILLIILLLNKGFKCKQGPPNSYNKNCIICSNSNKFRINNCLKCDQEQNSNIPECIKICTQDDYSGYYFDDNKYKKCFYSCKVCNGNGNYYNHNCEECSDGYYKLGNGNCYSNDTIKYLEAN